MTPASGPSGSRVVHTGSSSAIQTSSGRDAADDPLLEFASEQPAPRQSLFVIVPAELSDDRTGGWSARVNHTYRGLWEKRTRVARRYLSDQVRSIENRVRGVAVASLDNTRALACHAAGRSADLLRGLTAATWSARVNHTYRGLWEKRTRVARRYLSNQVRSIENRVRGVAVASLDNTRALACYAAKRRVDFVREFKVRLVPMMKPLPGRLAIVAAIASTVIWLVRVEVPSNVATAGESGPIGIDAGSPAEFRQSTPPPELNVDSRSVAAPERRVERTFATQPRAVPAPRLQGSRGPVTEPQQSVKVANLLDIDSQRPPAATAMRGTPTGARQGGSSPARFRGTLAVQSQPRGARVFINGQPVGITPIMLRQLPIGSRAIRIEADGYQPWSGSIRVVANQQTPVNQILSPLTQ